LFGLLLCLHHGRRPRRARHLDHGAGALHLPGPGEDQPARRRLRGLGAAVPRVAAADRPALRGPAARQRRGGRVDMAAADTEPSAPLRLDFLPKHGVLLFAAFLALVPTLFMIFTALKSDAEYGTNKVGIPQALVFDNFREVFFDSPFFAWMGNSLILAL